MALSDFRQLQLEAITMSLKGQVTIGKEIKKNKCWELTFNNGAKAGLYLMGDWSVDTLADGAKLHECFQSLKDDFVESINCNLSFDFEDEEDLNSWAELCQSETKLAQTLLETQLGELIMERDALNIKIEALKQQLR